MKTLAAMSIAVGFAGILWALTSPVKLAATWGRPHPSTAVADQSPASDP